MLEGVTDKLLNNICIFSSVFTAADTSKIIIRRPALVSHYHKRHLQYPWVVLS
jgi:hypothetical protein